MCVRSLHSVMYAWEATLGQWRDTSDVTDVCISQYNESHIRNPLMS